ncbi:MAG TPA: pentapeptide repeat-containing protein [Chthoniobacteraceae bacterium]|nr:pentapeptide repeat-containing protein [Chthoniobacteraceae bacterium]
MKSVILRFIAIITSSALAQAAFADGKDFHDQNLKNHDFRQTTLNGANFEGATLDGANFNNASAKNANFKGASLGGGGGMTTFQMTDLTGADFRESTGKPFFDRATLDKANFEGVALSPEGCSLRGADLKGAKLVDAMNHCDFTGADLRGANLRAAMPSGLKSSKWKGAIYDDDTSFPDGFDPKDYGMVLNNDKDAAQAGAGDTKPTDASKPGKSTSFFPGAAANGAVTMASVAGKYVGEDNKETTFVLGADGSLTVHEGGQDMTGTYKIDGDTLNFTLGGETASAKVVGKELVPTGDNGQKMMKQ